VTIGLLKIQLSASINKRGYENENKSNNKIIKIKEIKSLIK